PRLEQGWNRGTGLVFQFDLGQIGTLTPSPCSTPVPIWDTNPVPLFHPRLAQWGQFLPRLHAKRRF
ncbi:MAG: hypothetical protein FWE96_08435, partial [Coriobacteriia bacterium]|nr:hypothetical protein [Coriobacteriia bacterium]